MSHVEDASSSLLKKLECLSCDLTGDSAPWPTKAWSKQPAQPVHILTRPPHGNKFAIYPANAAIAATAATYSYSYSYSYYYYYYSDTLSE